MFGQKFYHGTIRKTVIIFGSLFNDIVINKYNDNGDIIKSIPVPLSYGPREKYLSRIDAKNNPITLPRLSFEMVDMMYDPDRKLSKVDQITKEITENGDIRKHVYNPVPYNLNFNVSLMVKSNDDGIQVIEQIVPFFSPTFTIPIHIIPEMDIQKDIIVTLNSMAAEDQYEGDYDTRRVLTWDLQFTVKTFLYGPIKEQNVIKKAITDIHDNTDPNNDVTLTRQVVDEDDYFKDDNFGFGDAITDYPAARE